MKDCDIAAFLDDIDSRFPVNKWMMEGRHVWPYIKMELCSFLSMEEKIESGTLTKKKERIIQQTERIKNAVFRASGIQNLRGEVVILHPNVGRNIVLKDGSKFDRILDPFVLLLENTCTLTNLEDKGKSHCFPLFRNSFIIDGYMDRAAIQAKISSYISHPSYNLPQYSVFLHEIPEKAKPLLQTNVLDKKLKRLNIFSSSIKRVLQNGSRLALGEDGYGEYAMALFMACYDLGIRCAEIQHGVGAGAGHRWYASWGKMPETGRRYEMLPDIYWCWTEKDKKVIDSWSQGRHTAFYGERPIFSVLPELEHMISDKQLSFDQNKKTILLSLQPEVEYRDWLVDIIKESQDEYNWVIRRHPSFDERQEQFIKKLEGLNSVYIRGMENVLLESLLSQTHLHITNHSSVVTDALLFNIPSIIMGEEYANLFQDEMNAGKVVLCNEKGSMNHMIHQLINHEKQNPLIHADWSERSREFLLHQMDMSYR